MPQEQIFSFELPPRPEKVDDKPSKEMEDCEHRNG
jgi:hypothetical protein